MSYDIHHGRRCPVRSGQRRAACRPERARPRSRASRHAAGRTSDACGHPAQRSNTLPPDHLHRRGALTLRVGRTRRRRRGGSLLHAPHALRCARRSHRRRLTRAPAPGQSRARHRDEQSRREHRRSVRSASGISPARRRVARRATSRSAPVARRSSSATNASSAPPTGRTPAAPSTARVCSRRGRAPAARIAGARPRSPRSWRRMAAASVAPRPARPRSPIISLPARTSRAARRRSPVLDVTLLYDGGARYRSFTNADRTTLDARVRAPLPAGLRLELEGAGQTGTQSFVAASGAESGQQRTRVAPRRTPRAQRAARRAHTRPRRTLRRRHAERRSLHGILDDVRHQSSRSMD